MQSRLLMGFVAGALAVGCAWFFLSYPADPTGAAIGVKRARSVKTVKAPAKDGRSHSYMQFDGVGSSGETIFVVNEGEQPNGVNLAEHCKLECDWEEDCRGVQMTEASNGQRGCALKSAAERSRDAEARFLQKWESLDPKQAKVLALAGLEAERGSASLEQTARERFQHLGVSRKRLDPMAADAVSLIELIAARSPLDTLHGEWTDLLKSWDKPSPASVSLFVQWSMRMAYEVADGKLQVQADAVSFLNGHRQLLWKEMGDIRKRQGELARLDDSAPFQPAVHPKDIGLSELTGALELVDNKATDYNTKRALKGYFTALQKDLKVVSGELKTARAVLSRKLKAQQTFYQGLASVGRMLLDTSEELLGEETTPEAAVGQKALPAHQNKPIAAPTKKREQSPRRVSAGAVGAAQLSG